MSDNLEWRNKHAVLLREPQWAGIASRENYRIRADLRPLFEAHPESEDLLQVLEERKLYAEGCEFLARMMHRRAAVWWGYCCMMSKILEGQAVDKGAKTASSANTEMLDLVRKRAEELGVRIPDIGQALSAATTDDLPATFPRPEIDWKRLFAVPVPPQDEAPVRAASKALQSTSSKTHGLVPPSVIQALDESRAACVRRAGNDPQTTFAAACDAAAKNPLTYTINRERSATMRNVMALPQQADAEYGKMKDTLARFGLVPPADPEGAKLYHAERQRKTEAALEAVWRWLVAPDEKNTALALEAGNAAGGAEGMLAYTAAWSFGDLTPEGAQMIPVPPELPGTGLTMTLLQLALNPKGTRSPEERYELFYKLGLDVVRGFMLWPEEMDAEKAPHEDPKKIVMQRRVGFAMRHGGKIYAETPEELAEAEIAVAEFRARKAQEDHTLSDEEVRRRVSVAHRAKQGQLTPEEREQLSKESFRAPETLATIKTAINRITPTISTYKKWSK